jgi:hypothetical protein
MAPVTLVLIHGRAQGGKDPEKLKQNWLETLRFGLGRERSAILERVNVVFPFYGDTLDGFVQELGSDIPADILVRGDPPDMDEEYKAFHAKIAEEVKQGLSIGDSQVELYLTQEARERSALNWKWVQALLRAADAIPGVSARAIEGFTRDVYVYLSVSRIRDTINRIVDTAIPTSKAIVVAHSLGSVVAYDVFQKASRSFDIPLHVSVGSPLGVGPIRRVLAPLSFPRKVGSWYNAFDERDVVALHPLDSTTFDVKPPVENYTRVRNGTENAHGIAGYLNDPTVAARIYNAIAATL